MTASRISRRAFLASSAGVLGGCTLMRHVGLASEVSKQEALYQDQPRGNERCAECRYFKPPYGCTQVVGPVSPQGWCKLWAR